MTANLSRPDLTGASVPQLMPFLNISPNVARPTLGRQRLVGLLHRHYLRRAQPDSKPGSVAIVLTDRKKIERKKMSVRDENRHLDVKREVNFRMSALIDQYWSEYGRAKKSSDREKSVLERIRRELGNHFVREVDGPAVQRWYRGLTEDGLSAGTAVRHFNVMHHMMEKAATLWSKETGIDRNPADQVEVNRPDDQRERYLSAEEIATLKQALDTKLYGVGTRDVNQTFYPPCHRSDCVDHRYANDGDLRLDVERPSV